MQALVICGLISILLPAPSRTATFFFCGCEPCHVAAKQWGQIQRSGELGGKTPAKTRIVFLGDAEAAKAFAAETSLDMKQTEMIPDPKHTIALKYKVTACPRAFVYDAKRALRYTNTHKDDQPPKGPPALIVARVIDALRAAAKPKESPRGKR